MAHNTAHNTAHKAQYSTQYTTQHTIQHDAYSEDRLCLQTYQNWLQKFGVQLGKKVVLLTGETATDLNLLAQVKCEGNCFCKESVRGNVFKVIECMR